MFYNFGINNIVSIYQLLFSHTTATYVVTAAIASEYLNDDVSATCRPGLLQKLRNFRSLVKLDTCETSHAFI